MRVRVTCSGVLIGFAEFEPPDGLAHTILSPAPGYALASAASQALARDLGKTQHWSAYEGDFADVAAARWEGGRLALEDETQQELGVANVVVLEYPAIGQAAPVIRVVADFRPDLARVEAFLRTLGGPGGRTRPAA